MIVVHRASHHPEGTCRGLDCDIERRSDRSVWVEDDSNPFASGRDLLEQLQPDRRIADAEPGDIAAGSREALNQAEPD
jgi:hypothetical protein